MSAARSARLEDLSYGKEARVTAVGKYGMTYFCSTCGACPHHR